MKEKTITLDYNEYLQMEKENKIYDKVYNFLIVNKQIVKSRGPQYGPNYEKSILIYKEKDIVNLLKDIIDNKDQDYDIEIEK